MRPSTIPLAAALGLCLAAGCGGASEEPAEPPPADPTTGGSTADVTEPPPEPAAAEPAAPAEPTSTDSGSGRAPGDDTPATYACRLADDFNLCIVERLEGRADSEAEMMQLIQSYRLLGRMDEARAHMEEFVQDYPDSPQAQTYRDYLGGPGI